jgi:hypothetical protein
MTFVTSVSVGWANGPYYFRYYTMTRKGQSDLSQVVSLLVK